MYVYRNVDIDTQIAFTMHNDTSRFDNIYTNVHRNAIAVVFVIYVRLLLVLVLVTRLSSLRVLLLHVLSVLFIVPIDVLVLLVAIQV